VWPLQEQHFSGSVVEFRVHQATNNCNSDSNGRDVSRSSSCAADGDHGSRRSNFFRSCERARYQLGISSLFAGQLAFSLLYWDVHTWKVCSLVQGFLLVALAYYWLIHLNLIEEGEIT
jgi:hypothetical protein